MEDVETDGDARYIGGGAEEKSSASSRKRAAALFGRLISSPSSPKLDEFNPIIHAADDAHQYR